MKIIFSLLILSIHFLSFNQNTKLFWNIIDTTKASHLVEKKIIQKKKTTTKWNQEDEIYYYFYLGKNQYALRNYDSCIYFLNQGILVAKNDNKDSIMGEMMRYKGNAFYFLKNSNKAKSILYSTLQLSKKKKLHVLEADVYSSLAILDIEKVNIIEAETLLEKAMKIYNYKSDSSYVGFLQARYLLIACNKYTGKEKQVLKKCDKLLKDLRKQSDLKLLAGHLFFYSLCLFEAKQPTEAISLLNEAEKLAENSNDIDIQRQALSEKASILSQIGNYKEAYEASKKSQELYAKMLNRDVAKASADAEIKYQTKEKINEIRTQKKLLSQEKKEKSLYIVVAILFLALMLIVLIVIRKTHRLKTEKLEQEKKEISFNKLLEGEENEKARIAKELHDGVVQDLSVLYLNLNQLKNVPVPEQQTKQNELLKQIKNTTNEVRNLSHQMMPIALREKGLVVALEDLFSRSLPPLNIAYTFDVFNLEEKLDAKIEISIYRIVQELFNNVIKHSKANEVICVLRKKEDKLILIIEDNGIGLNEIEQKTGLGLTSLNSRLEFLNGKIEMHNAENASGLFTRIEIPILRNFT